MLSSLLLALIGVGIQAAGPQSNPPDRELLTRVGQYVQGFENRLAAIIGDETYHQDVWDGRRRLATRTIHSEMLFLSLSREGAWTSGLSVRNVLSVDGRAVEDSHGRLDRILTSPELDAVSQLRLLQAEGARFDVGRVWRSTGDPTLVFRFLLPANQSRFTFDRAQRDRVDGTDVVGIAFVEREHPTAVDIDGRDVISRGDVERRCDRDVQARQSVVDVGAEPDGGELFERTFAHDVRGDLRSISAVRNVRTTPAAQ